MKFIDMHCDTLLKLFFAAGKGANLYDFEPASVDFRRMEAGGQLAQFFAVFLLPQEMLNMEGVTAPPDMEYIETLRNLLLSNIERHTDIMALAVSAEEILENEKAGKISAVLSMEDSRAVDGKLDNVKLFYDMGFRAMSLTWNAPNCFGSPNSTDAKINMQGLTAFGKTAVEYMQELGILVDVSHLSDGGFYDVAAICKKPFIATHSNARSLCPHQRNLTDDMIRVIGNAGGVTGLNFCPAFLNKNISCNDSTAALLAKHARHIANVGGVSCVALGSDFDGFEGNLEIEDCAKLHLLEGALREEGFAEAEIEQIFYKNVLRVMKDSIK